MFRLLNVFSGAFYATHFVLIVLSFYLFFLLYFLFCFISDICNGSIATFVMCSSCRARPHKNLSWRGLARTCIQSLEKINIIITIIPRSRCIAKRPTTQLYISQLGVSTKVCVEPAKMVVSRSKVEIEVAEKTGYLH